MAITMVLLEKMLVSEVENLHDRINEHSTILERFEQRFDSVDRRLDLLYLEVDGVRENVQFIKDNYATKEDLDNFVTKDDAKAFATKEDLKELSNQVQELAAQFKELFAYVKKNLPAISQ